MKRFFSRFSATGPVSPDISAQNAAPFDHSEKQDASGPHPAPAILASNDTVGRTKALVAKFESPPPAQSTHALINASPAAPHNSIRTTDSGVTLASIDLSVKALPANSYPSVPQRLPGSSLSEEHSSTAVKPTSPGTAVDLNVSDTTEKDRDLRRQSSASQTTKFKVQHSKAVAFAPSPQKQRSTSPAHTSQLQHLTASQSVSRANSTDNDTNTGRGSFARPTVASQARSKTWSRSAASDASLHSPLLLDKAPAGFNRSSSPMHTHPAARRSFSYSSDPVSGKHDPFSATQTTANRVNVAASSSRRISAEIPRSRNTASATSSQAAMMASDPLHFPSRTSVPMRKSYSASTSSHPVIRRYSIDAVSPTGSDAPVVFPPSGGAASRSFGFPTWSEMTHGDLVRNLGPRERTRQEVLWEIVASEQRYVLELEKVKELYIDALLHPDLFDPERVIPPPPSNTASSPLEAAGSSEWSPVPHLGPVHSIVASVNPSNRKAEAHCSPDGALPIAARFMSEGPTGQGATGDLSVRASESRVGTSSPYSAAFGRTSSPYSSASPSEGRIGRVDATFGLGLGLGTKATKDRSAAAYMNTSSTSRDKSKLSKAQKLRGLSLRKSGDTNPLRLSVPLPPSLREVLVAISDGLAEAHGMLSEALRARYEEQWPLVRSLADVFMKHSHILQKYASYVCHLQRAMEELEEAALMERAFRGKRLGKERLSNTVGLGRSVAALETCAAEQGYAGLTIFMSMPFQRLLKYPLLFQNLLFHTDPSTHEFESTVAMVVEVERLVRSIEDEKINAEERDRTRDVFARVDGITDRQVLRPRSSRVLIEEKALYDEHARRTLSESAPTHDRGDVAFSESEGAESGTEGSDHSARRRKSSKQLGLRATLREKRSYRRLSDFLSSDQAATGSSKAPAMGSKKDLWIVRFSDVELKCQRIGVTSLPMVSSAALRSCDQAAANEANDLAARSKESRERLKALRSTTLRAKTRNLYKFISVVAWRNAAAAHQMDHDQRGMTDCLPTFDEEDGGDDGVSVSTAGDGSASDTSSSGSSSGVGGRAGSEKYIRSTKLSFTYWGDRIEPGRTAAGAPGASTKVGLAHARDGASLQDGARSSDQVEQGRAASLDTAVATSTGSVPTRGTAHGQPRQPRKSASNTHARRSNMVQGRSGVSGRLSEPMAATSMSTAPEPMQNAVAQMHAKQRNDKFGGRLRTSLANSTEVAAGLGGKDGSQASVDIVRDGPIKSNGVQRKSNAAADVGRAI